MLNAFRHLRIHHTDSLGAGGNPLPVLNAFRHLRIHHFFRLARLARCIFVLNAFRHLRIHHCLEQVQSHNILRCSTPFGIFEFITWQSQYDHAQNRRAQRLSASSNSSPSEVYFEAWSLDISAQRLSASSNSSHRVPSINSTVLSSAQRLSASSNSSLGHIYSILR